jgi:hypothetical protein
MRLNTFKMQQKGVFMESIVETSRKELVKRAEDRFSLVYEEPVKFGGFINIHNDLELKFIFTEGSMYLPFTTGWEDLELYLNYSRV